MRSFCGTATNRPLACEGGSGNSAGPLPDKPLQKLDISTSCETIIIRKPTLLELLLPFSECTAVIGVTLPQATHRGCGERWPRNCGHFRIG
jgi:hypothetical protein